MEATVPTTEIQTAAVPQIQLGNVLQIPAVRQVLLLVGVALAVAAGVAVVMWSQKPEYRSLYSGLEQREAAAVVDALRNAGVDYDIADSGAILVPADQLQSARMQLASQGLGQSQGGMDDMGESSSFGVSQFMETARYQHAIEAELSQTIKSLRAVQEARVHLAIPKESAFIRDRQRPSASVLLQLYGGQQLEAGQAESIINLVASAIPNMAPADVTLIDQFGNLLSSDGEMENDAMTANQFKMTREFEADYRRRIEAILIPLLGHGNVRAEVTASLDFTVVEATTEAFDPTSQVVRSEQINEQQRQANDALAGGVPGALTNTPPEAGGLAADPADQANTLNSSRSSTRNFEMDRTISRTRSPSSRIQRLSVAVIVDEVALTASEAAAAGAEVPAEGDAAAADAGAATAASVTVEPPSVAEIEALVREAVGFDQARGDSVGVVVAPFRPAPLMEPGEGPAIWEQPIVREIGKQAGGVLLVLVLAFGIVRPMLKSIVTPPAPSGGLSTLLPSDGEGGGRVAGQLDAPSTPGLSYQEKVAAARNITGHDPARVAQVVRKWIDDSGE
ncbi:MAG: flagellar basal-body MS-ring/collar protein FliF [Pseudomonadota bacterium]